jgi:hypothetical protein
MLGGGAAQHGTDKASEDVGTFSRGAIRERGCAVAWDVGGWPSFRRGAAVLHKLQLGGWDQQGEGTMRRGPETLVSAAGTESLHL